MSVRNNGISKLVLLLRQEKENSFHNFARLKQQLLNFINQHDNFDDTEEGLDATSDELSLCFSCLNEGLDNGLILLLQTLKILMRKVANQELISASHVSEIMTVLFQHSQDETVLTEIAAVILNMCYSKKAVEYFLSKNILSFLSEVLLANNTQLVANSCGAIQSICFETVGKSEAVNHPELLKRLCAIVMNTWNNFDEENNCLMLSKLLSRAVGAIHNISSDSKAILTLHEEGLLATLADLLKFKDLSVAGSAAGTLQNMSRDKVCRQDILANPLTLPGLTHLLFCSLTAAQVCALGALLNLLRPSCETPAGVMRRQVLHHALTQSLFLGILNDCLDNDDSS
eukprot:GCRY01002536.1.p1 GENE.GCRY01002536.1~~GCRY01002536.1.p1  ORF type:complete len:343 (+),score=43.82 GCRY01002536.1:205-1233(+)